VRDVLIYGGGMLGLQLAHLLRFHFVGSHRLLGFIDDVRPAAVEVWDGLHTVGSLEQALASESHRPGQVELVFGIGYSDMLARRRAFDRARSAGYGFVTLIHPRAHVEPTARLGEAVTILAGALVDQFVSIGDACYFDMGSKVSEDCRIGTNNYFTSGSTLAGHVKVGDDNFFGTNCTVTDRLKIGNHNFVNAATLVYRPVGDHTRVVEYREQRDVSMPR